MNLLSLFKTTLFILYIFLIYSCKSRTHDNLILNSNEAILNSTQIIKDQNKMIFDLLLRKLIDPQYSEVTSRRYPKAKEIRELSKNLRDEIIIIRDSFPISKSKLQAVYINLANYFKKFIEVDEKCNIYFKRQKQLSTFYNILADTTKNTFIREFESYRNKEDNIAAVNVLENNIVTLENFVLTLSNNYSDFIRDDFSIRFSVLVNQNTKHLKAGENLEIQAGIGSFSRASMPQVIVEGKNIEVTESGIAEYKLTAPKQTGRHVVPISIIYTQPDGTKRTLVYPIEYFVDP